MSYEDHISIATPEGLDLDLTLAGLGSRFAAAVIDGLIQFALVSALWAVGLALGLGFGAAEWEVGEGAAMVLMAVVLVLVFLLLFGYHVFFETCRVRCEPSPASRARSAG